MLWRLYVLLVVIAVLAGGFIWWLLRPGEAPPALAAAPLAGVRGYVDQPALSPDGSRVAFISNHLAAENLDVYLKPVGPGAAVRLTTHPAVEYSPAFSPDGRSIAFLRAAQGGFHEPSHEIVMPAGGGPERKQAEVRLQPDPHLLPGPFLAWTPDSTGLVVTDQESPGGSASLYLLAVGAGDKRRLTSPPQGAPGDSGPAFSPDGRTLAFARFLGFAVGDIFVVPLTAEFMPERDAERRTYENRFNAMPAWAPDGDEIVYSAWSGSGYALYRVKAAGPEAPQKLSGAGEGGLSASVSARRHRLLYVRSRSDVNVWRWEAGGLQALVTSERFDGFADVSPDGQQVALTSARSGSLEVWTCGSHGSNCVQLTSLHAGFTGFPRWSPDRQYLAFFSNLEGQNEVYVIPASGGRPRRLTEDPADDILPSWSRDSNWIYFASNLLGAYQVWKVPAFGAQGRPAQVTSQGGFAALESSDGQFLYYSREGLFTTSLWRVPVATSGRETKLLDSVYANGFAVTDRGLYCLLPRPNSHWGASLQFLNLAGGQPRLVAKLDRPVHQGLSAAADARSAVFTQVDRQLQELMLVENFR